MARPGAGASRSSTSSARASLGGGAPDARSVSAWEHHLAEEVDPDALRAELARGDLPSAFHRVAVEAGERAALTIGEQSIAHGELDRAAGKVGAWLRERGVQPGDRVVICASSSVPFVIADLGILRAGAVATLADATLTERELRHVVATSGAVAAFASGDPVGRLEAIAEDTPLRWVASLDARDRGPRLEEALSSRVALPPGKPDGERAGVLGYTSGTTGDPKGAPLSHSNMLSSARSVMLAWRWREDDVLVHSLPLSHQHGLTGVHVTLLAGSRAVIQPCLDPARLTAAIAGERASVLFAVPAVYERLLSWGGGGDFSSLRLATSGSAPLAPRLWEKARELIAREPVERYGTTESGLDVSNPYDGPRRPGSVGIPLPGIEIAIADPEGNVLPDGADGEVLVRGPHVFDGYWRDDGATRQSFHPGGWFRTGDVGRLDPDDGYLSITGRLKELIISGGLNVYPREVELVLEQHPSVGRAAVVGVPSRRWGEEVVAFVVPEGGAGLDEEEVRSHVRRVLAPHKRPKAVHEVDDLPVNVVGKVLRAELVALAQRLRGEAGR